MMRRTFMFTVAFSLLIAALATPLLAPQKGLALTKKETQACYDKYSGLGSGDGTNGKLTTKLQNQYEKSNCPADKDGTCNVNGSSRGMIIVCANPDAPTGAKENQVGSFSTTCVDKNDICVSGLPRTEANASFVQNILRIVLGIIGAVAVLFVAIGGLRYVFSQGDPQAVAKAKSTIVFALIGLLIAIIAQGIVALVVRAFS